MRTFSTQKPPKNGLFLASRRPPPPGPPQDLCSGPLPTPQRPKNPLKITLYTYTHTTSIILSFFLSFLAFVPSSPHPPPSGCDTQNPLSGLGGRGVSLAGALETKSPIYRAYILLIRGVYIPPSPPQSRTGCPAYHIRASAGWMLNNAKKFARRL